MPGIYWCKPSTNSGLVVLSILYPGVIPRVNTLLNSSIRRSFVSCEQNSLLFMQGFLNKP